MDLGQYPLWRRVGSFSEASEGRELQCDPCGEDENEVIEAQRGWWEELIKRLWRA
jgi:hypothetical protein